MTRMIIVIIHNWNSFSIYNKEKESSLPQTFFLLSHKIIKMIEFHEIIWTIRNQQCVHPVSMQLLSTHCMSGVCNKDNTHDWPQPSWH